MEAAEGHFFAEMFKMLNTRYSKCQCAYDSSGSDYLKKKFIPTGYKI